ncbi:hypothetical protein [Haloplanus sp.]|uniref:hypothetical protein n=1 Tax=Haloplanus sp. TaxID=1961696 RepID=UPI002603B972|nr:hypothetical protein [Haloplanus sp.]
MHGDDHDGQTCGRCEEPIPVDADYCPMCGYRPAGYNRTATRVGMYVFGAVCVASIVVFIAGVSGIAPGIPTETISKMAIVTPYTAGISGFFTYYLYQKHGAEPTDDEVWG